MFFAVAPFLSKNIRKKIPFFSFFYTPCFNNLLTDIKHYKFRKTLKNKLLQIYMKHISITIYLRFM
jgi:hypothetical protein